MIRIFPSSCTHVPPSPTSLAEQVPSSTRTPTSHLKKGGGCKGEGDGEEEDEDEEEEVEVEVEDKRYVKRSRKQEPESKKFKTKIEAKVHTGDTSFQYDYESNYHNDDEYMPYKNSIVLSTFPSKKALSSKRILLRGDLNGRPVLASFLM